MKVRYTRLVAADCTSDPHPVNYGDVEQAGTRAMLKVMFEDIIRVCESDMVMCVRNVHARIGNTIYKSDEYDIFDSAKTGKKASTIESKKHKVYGMYFVEDVPELDSQGQPIKHLPPGLTGVRELAKVVLKRSEDLGWISIGVIWTFAGDASCSDYIEIGDEWRANEVNFGSQNWWTNLDGYGPWCDQMEELLGREFPRADTGS